jgi:uncharacterized protein (DUF1800 family)
MWNLKNQSIQKITLNLKLMNRNTIWSLRLGFSNKQSTTIESIGLKDFLLKSFDTKVDKRIPDFLSDAPKNLIEYRENKNKIKSMGDDKKKELLKKQVQTFYEMKSWWIDKMITDEYPLREKMTCFWHNHYVSTYQKVKVNYWVFQHNQVLRENAFGNFKDLTKKVLKTNAMVRYLDNVDNRKGKINENLSRELLELFTLGIGNYTENDIKNGAKALAGLGIGVDEAQYRKIFVDNDSITYLGKKGNFKVDEIVDIIFEQKKIPYLITRKILKWFIYDEPKEELVIYYGDYFRKENFEIKPLLIKIFTEEYSKDNAGSKIKNPLEYITQLITELNIKKVNTKYVANFLKVQGMDLFNQPNVKGWDGSNSWLTSLSYLQRNNAADLLCKGQSLNRIKKLSDENSENQMQNMLIKTALSFNKKGTNKDVISELKERLLFHADEDAQKDFETILKYDFDATSEGSENAVLRLFNTMVKMPEFQLI